MSFRLEDQIGDVGAVNPNIVQPVESASAAGLIRDVAGIAEVGYKKIQTARGQQLGVDLTKELGAEVSYTQAEMALDAARQAAIDEGSKQGMDIAQGRARLSPTEFRARAETRLRAMMAANPLFAEEIAKGFASVTRYDPRGEINASLFEQLVKEPKLTPEQKARQFEYDENLKFAELYNVSVEQADQMRANQARLEFDANIATKQVDAGRVKQNQLFSTTATTSGMRFIAEIAAVAKQNGGSLPPDQFKLLQNKIPGFVAQYKSSIVQKLGEQGLTVASISDLDAQAKSLQETLTSYLTNQDAVTFMDKNIQYAQKSATASLLTKRSFRKLYAIKSVGGEQVASQVWDALTSKNYRQFLENNPIMRDLMLDMDQSVDPDLLERQALVSADKALNGEKLTLSDIQTTKYLSATNKDFREALPEETINAILKTDPASLDMYLSKSYEADIIAGKVKLKDIVPRIETNAKAMWAQYMGLSGKSVMLTDLSFKDEVTGRQKGVVYSKPTLRDQDGDLVPSEIYTSFMSIKRLADKYPALWEEEFDSSVDFAKSKLLSPVKKDKKEEEETPIEQPQASLSKEMQMKMKVESFKRQFPEDAKVFSDEEIAAFYRDQDQGIA